MQRTRSYTRVAIAISAASIGLTANALAQSSTTIVSREPGNYSQVTTVTGAGGKSATFQDSKSWGGGSYTDNRSIIGFNGKTATSNTSATYGSGSASRQTTTTGFNGKTTNYSDSASWGNGSFKNDRSYTGVNGGTVSRSTSRAGGIVTNTYTGRNGNSRTFAHRVRRR